MALSYQAFKDHLAVFLWRQNDNELKGSLDALINMGNSAISRDLRHERRHVSATLPVTTLDLPLPVDYYSMRSVVDAENKYGEFFYKEPATVMATRDKSQLRQWSPIYSLKDKIIMLSGPVDLSDPNNIVVHYRASIPDFQTTDSSWVADEMLDLYTYGVLKHASAFLREDERVGLWSTMYTEVINQYNEESAHSQTIGQYGAMPLARQAGVRRRGDRSTSGKLY